MIYELDIPHRAVAWAESDGSFLKSESGKNKITIIYRNDLSDDLLFGQELNATPSYVNTPYPTSNNTVRIKHYAEYGDVFADKLKKCPKQSVKCGDVMKTVYRLDINCFDDLGKVLDFSPSVVGPFDYDKHKLFTKEAKKEVALELD